jgi:hypothetical protein
MLLGPGTIDSIVTHRAAAVAFSNTRYTVGWDT